MNIEQTEGILHARRGEKVTVVRPGYGSQSDSWAGDLSVINKDYPMKFEVSSLNYATIFKSTDVSSVEDRGQLVIRLKGPHDYRGQLVNA